MPKGIDPKAYAARLTRAKKIIAKIDPATKIKIKDMYPRVTKESIANQALNPRKAAMKKSPAKPAVKRPTAKPATLPKPKRTPLETKRVGGIIAIPRKPKKTVY